MTQMNRRRFLATTAGAASAVAAAPAILRAVGTDVRPPQVPLGDTGITLSRVAQGTGMRGGNRQSNHTRMGIEKFSALARHAYDQGITFFDAADLYGTHIYLREALKGIPREQLTFLTKVWCRYDKPMRETADAATIKEAAKITLQRFCHELNTEYIDVVLLHCMIDPGWPDDLAPYMDALTEAKAKEQVRAVGVSCHNLDALKTAASCPWVDVILARINPNGARMDGSPEEVIPVLQEARKNGKAIIGMKIYGEGQLVDQKEKCIKFAQTSGLLDAMTIGFEEPKHIDETLALMAKYPAVGTSG